MSPSYPTPVVMNAPASPGLFFSFLTQSCRLFRDFISCSSSERFLVLLLLSPALSLSLNSAPVQSQVRAVEPGLIYISWGHFLPSLAPGCPQPVLAWHCPHAAVPSLALAASFVPETALGASPRAPLCSEGLEVALGHQHMGSRG